eukprot:TRINITY_DN3438_c0_g3_i1.p1 TRINITY_DN3438_c0_g3~~TRINITY_DN3438_c0_g3_i1.p1  ORF type:complete len:812 (+),score=200.23 TRINITY_DN3438_c0_g3_i1:66-2438(+)
MDGDADVEVVPPPSACASCCFRLINVAVRDTDSEEDSRLKRLLTPYILAVDFIALFINAVLLFRPLWTLFHLIWVCAGVSCLAATACLFCVPPRRAAEMTCVLVMILVFTVDCVNAANLRLRVWSVIVSVVDVALVAELNQRLVLVIICSTVVFLLFLGTEQVGDYGVFRALKSSEQSTPLVCDCSDPPCSLTVDVAASESLAYVLVFLYDFYVTQGFARNMRHQMKLVSTAVEVCDIITNHVSRYEVEAARELISSDSGRQLPEGLHHSYLRLLSNLESYKPYLPDSLLFTEASTTDDNEWLSPARPPGEGDGDEADVCIVFSDIQSSTALWEEYHQAMYEGLQMHNWILRRQADAFGGYEVKTIGDAFMLAFADVKSAVAFALEAQVQLAKAEWPTDLSRAPLCRRVDGSGGVPLWNGLRVRVGIHCGTVRVERNPVTKRCDYFGPVVNTAARIESDLKHGGLIGVSQEVLSRLGDAGLRELGGPAVSLFGHREMKGVSTAVTVHVVLPEVLARRSLVRREGSTGSVPTTTTTNSISLRESMRLDPPQRRNSAGTVSSTGSAAPSRFALQLKRTAASSAHVAMSLFECDTAKVQQFVAAVEHAADVSQGVVQSVLSSSCVVTWNAPRHCTGHVAQCSHFTTAVVTRCDALSVRSYAGAASGIALSGNLAGCRRRFATVVAGCIELAGVLAGVAELGRVRTLLSGPIVQHCPTAARVGSLRTVAEEEVAVWMPQPDTQAKGPATPPDAASDRLQAAMRCTVRRFWMLDPKSLAEPPIPNASSVIDRLDL